MEYKENGRGYKVLLFKDVDENECSLQESSLIEPAIWIGLDHIQPKLFLPDIDKTMQGWINYPISECVKLFGRMELTQQQVKELLPYLQFFAENEVLPEKDDIEKGK